MEFFLDVFKRGAKWLSVNIGLPLIIEAVKRFSERKKFIESSSPDSKEEKLKQILKEDGFDVK